MSEGADTRTDILPLTTNILSQQQRVAQATGDLTILLTSIAIAAKWISNVVRKADLLKVLGVDSGTNVHGEAQQKLDVLSNQTMINMLRRSAKTAIMVSEENEEAIFMDGENLGSYCVVLHPLEGSSNIDCGVSIGTIFGIYKLDNEDYPKVSDVLRPGTAMVAAGHLMYGSSTVLVLTIDGKGRYYFILYLGDWESGIGFTWVSQFHFPFGLAEAFWFLLISHDPKTPARHTPHQTSSFFASSCCAWRSSDVFLQRILSLLAGSKALLPSVSVAVSMKVST
ncbi:fructose-1-6-bisphosphatase-domain-containing protein [Cladochytrium replicatum]|nr:fructose-1-6-bisphosphatase-domain-containing protein [Cladochytrium replicatum]